MRTSYVYLTALLFMLNLTQLAYAGTSKQDLSMYQAQVPVTATSITQRRAAFTRGLATILVRVSGNSTITQTKAVKALLANAQDIVDAYRFVRTKPPAEPGIHPASHLTMHIQYDPVAVRNVLSKGHKKAWTSQRPVTLVWLTIQTVQGRTILGNDSRSQVAQYLRKTAKRRGIPLILPLLDIQDQSRITVSQVWHPDFKQLKAASKRYGAKAVLVGNVTVDKQDQWHANWLSWMNSEQHNWQTHADSLQAVLAMGVNEVADQLAQQFAHRVEAQPVHWLKLVVQDIDSMGAFSKVRAYLQENKVVDLLETQRIGDDEVVFRLKVTGGQEVLVDSLISSDHLQAIESEQTTSVTEPEHSEGSDTLYYRWVS